jgi:hypothetical protein
VNHHCPDTVDRSTNKRLFETKIPRFSLLCSCNNLRDTSANLAANSQRTGFLFNSQHLHYMVLPSDLQPIFYLTIPPLLTSFTIYNGVLRLSVAFLVQHHCYLTVVAAVKPTCHKHFQNTVNTVLPLPFFDSHKRKSSIICESISLRRSHRTTGGSSRCGPTLNMLFRLTVYK